MLFINIVLPVFLIISIGFLIGRTSNLDIKLSTHMALYIFTPALYFNSMLNTQIDGEIFNKIIQYAVILFISFLGLAYLVSKILGYSQDLRSALILSSTFPNSGNYGLPIILFAFAQGGFDRAIIFTAFQSLLLNSAGVYFASNSKNNIGQSIKNVLKMPGFLAIILAIIMRSFNIVLPDSLSRSVDLLGQAAIPTLLIILGIQLSNIKVVSNWKFISIATFMRLFMYPLVAYITILLLLDINTMTGKVLLVLSAVPSAVTTTLLAIRFDVKPELVSTVTLVTTLLSLLTVPTVLMLVH